MPAFHPALLAALGGGVFAAAMYLAVLGGTGGGMILVYLAPLPLFLTGLAWGPPAAGVAAGLATVIVAVATGGLPLPGVFVISSVLPALLLVRQALLSRSLADGSKEWYPPGLLLVLLAGLGVAVIAGACGLALAFDEDGGLKAIIRSLVVDPLVGMLHGDGSTADVAGDADRAEIVASVFPGVIAVSWLMMVVINGLLAQALLLRLGRLLRSPLRMREIALPGWLPLVLAVTTTGAMVLNGQAGFLLANLAIVQALPFFFAGLAVIHALAARWSSRVTILVAFYILLALLAWPVLAMVGLGVIDQWAGLRQRYAAGGPDRGEA